MKPLIDFGFFKIPTFYLVLSLTCVIALLWLSNRLEKNRSFDQSTAFDLSVLIMISGFLGGRLFHVFYEEPQYYFQNPIAILKFWNGGFVYYGGFFFSFVASILYCHHKHLKLLQWADFFTPLLSLAYALGRFGCFFEGCCYGKTCELPWAIHGKHPTQLYMAFSELFILVLILQLEKFFKKSHKPIGVLFLVWICFHSLSRFLIEFLRADDRGSMIMGLLSISQFISILIIGSSLFFLKKIQSQVNSEF